MSLSKPQIIVASLILLVVLVLVLGFLGIIPGLKKETPDRDPNFPVGDITLEVWGTDAERVFADAGRAYQASELTKNVQLKYTRFASLAELESAFTNALAEGRGPDVVMIRNTSVAQHAAKLYPAYPALVPVKAVNEGFPAIVAKDTVLTTAEGNSYVYALPLHLDALALIYNADIFNAKGVLSPPKTWDEVIAAVPSLRERSGNSVSLPALAFGTASNVRNFDRILESLFFQSGSNFYSTKDRKVEFDARASDAMRFYMQFADPMVPAYTWNASLEDSRSLFAKGGLAMIVDYHDALAEIRQKNNFINVKTASLPQLSSTPSLQKNAAAYWTLAVSRQAKNPYVAWHFIRFMTLVPSGSESYLAATGRLPALASLIQKGLEGENEPFLRGMLISAGWPRPDDTLVQKALKTAIDSITSGRTNVQQAMDTAENEINNGYRQ
jgi:ABC-type glycerol-3-phosphate transport system substrate-binding protein